GRHERRDRLCARHGHRADGGGAQHPYSLADHHDARPCRRAFPSDAVHVCRVGHFGDHEGYEDRPSHGVQPMNNPVVLEAVDIVKELGEGAGRVRALKGVSLSLRTGELTLLMGPSGSGKTTLLSILGCILTPTSGTVRIKDETTNGLTPEQLADLRRRHIGFVFQSYNLFPTLTALENVRLALDVRGMSHAETIERAEAALKAVGLSHKLRSYPRNMSGGEQQRVAVA